MASSAPPATPQRPTPGAFFNTPAPNRPALFRTSSTQQQLIPSGSTAPAVTAPSLSPIDRASRTVSNMLDQDANYRDLETYLGQGISGEYSITDGAWTPFEELKRYRIPDRILEQINMTQMSTDMGLFAEINHAWVTIDNQLYLWDYTNPNPELIGYEEQPNTILSVKLVKPRAKVFVDAISHLLVVATTQDMFLIAVQCEKGQEGVHGVTLFRTNLSTSVKGIPVSAIAGSDRTGRIFFGDGGSTEDVHELLYQQEERWFRSSCTRVNHTKKSLIPMLPFYPSANPVHVVQIEVDDTRNVLYTLSSNGSIRVFHMKDPSSLDLVITQSLSRTMSMCSHIVPQRSEALSGNKMEIVRIDTVSAREATSVSLIATTSTGCRIFLSTTTGGYGYSTDPNSPPSSMQVRHIRFPPIDPTQTPSPAPSNQLQPYQASAPIGFDSKYLTRTMNSRRYAPGSTFFFVKRSLDAAVETLFLTAPHSGQTSSQQDQTQNPRFTEDAQTMELSGFMQDIGLVTEPFAATSRPLGFGNELAVQFDKPLCEFAIMTHTGVQTLRRRRLVDIFAAIIRSGGGAEGIEGDLRRFHAQYGKRETTATALAVACGQGSYVGPDLRVAQLSDPDVLDYALKAFIEFGGKAQLNENASVEGGLNIDNVLPSPRHDGIAVYISRLVRSIWRSPIITQATTPTGSTLKPSRDVAKLREIQRALIALQEFLETNKQNIDGLAGPEALGRANSRQDEVEMQGENRALTSLMVLVNNIIEGIAFVLVMFEERLEDILALLPSETQTKVMQLTFQGLFSLQEGKDLAKALVKAIVTRNIAKGSNVETVADALRRKCGSFCSSDDVVIFKAQESLKKATDAGANSERGRILLNDSLRLFEQVAKSLSEEYLTQAVQTYVQMEFYAGAIRLALKVAQESDRANTALSWVKDGRPSPDAREPAYRKRTVCYDLIFKVIEAVDNANTNEQSVPDGIISPTQKRQQEAYEQINNSEDELFQNYLYDWYIKQGKQDRLLEIQSPFVVEYLRQSSSSDIAHADLLWRYYAHYNDFLNAAEVQFELAKSDFALSLEKRIEYLSRAKANASTRITGFSDSGVRTRQSRQELLRSIGDHLDNANIQDDLLQKFKSEPRLKGDKRKEVLEALDGKLQTLSDLYNNYADQAGYYDICLLIYHAADYRDLPAIRSTWTNLIEQTHEKGRTADVQGPWELVGAEVESIGRRVALNENVFPVNVLLQILLQYDLECYTHDPNGGNRNSALTYCPALTWPIDVFIRVGAPFEIMVATLEALWYAQEAPFTGRNRKSLIKWIIYTVEEWSHVSNRQGLLFGGEENAIGLADCLRVVLGSNELGRDTKDDSDWAERGRKIRAVVDAAAR
ncbi:non-repetitive nucleoporin-like protein [Westerdykella ornata]|uniref:Non-repetitive nucleoporin-like protein n=1 Tax=Westerdykella ornata TaxID=318751 RepID=A0A6A6J500_WESOR|nr:non-repetitive nucleoporin-like protein [Westerdykella ornata]KAF2271472.1 non-repetitive nucleoporin-like protein [Westerdykella ornata]